MQELIEALRRAGYNRLEGMDLKEEDVRFTLPAQLVQVTRRPVAISTQ